MLWNRIHMLVASISLASEWKRRDGGQALSDDDTIFGRLVNVLMPAPNWDRGKKASDGGICPYAEQARETVSTIHDDDAYPSAILSRAATGPARATEPDDGTRIDLHTR